MAIAKVEELSASSPEGFDQAVAEGLERASKTIRNIRSAWVKEQHVQVEDGRIAEYRVNLLITFVLED